MLKTRVIGVITLKNGRVVQSLNFSRYLPVGTLEVSLEYLNKWGIDEIVVLDIDATSEGRSPGFDRIAQASRLVQSPLSVGGGIKSVSDIEQLVLSGADKVVVNTEILLNPSILGQGARHFGSQCMIASIDAVCAGKGAYAVYSRNVDRAGKDVVETAKMAEGNGAGEIFLNSVDRDGMKNGYDLALFAMVKRAVSIPVILCGGVGKASHMVEGAKAGADAVAAGNFFHFSEMSVIATKQKMKRDGVAVRLDSYAKYGNAEFDKSGDRPVRLDEKVLDEMRFEYIPEEVI